MTKDLQLTSAEMADIHYSLYNLIRDYEIRIDTNKDYGSNDIELQSFSRQSIKRLKKLLKKVENL